MMGEENWKKAYCYGSRIGFAYGDIVCCQSKGNESKERDSGEEMSRHCRHEIG
jgi:hypothetical protein